MRSLKQAAIVVAASMGGCAEGSGTLEVTLDMLPALVSGPTVVVSGGVTRIPAKATDVIVTATGGAVAAADTVLGNRYEIIVRLNPNASNQLTISATDATGSTGNSVNVTVRQDGQVPTITLATPADTSDNVGLAPSIQVTFSEAVVLASGGGIRLTRQGVPFTGATTRSADSLRLTFAPSGSLSPNAIYRVGFSGVSDVASNALPATASTCFVTTPTGATAASTFPDERDSIYVTEPPPGAALQRPDIIAARFARQGSLLSAVFRFVGPRVFSSTASNQALIALEFDTDQDSTTGVWTIKDSIFYNSPSLGPTYSSGTKVERLVYLYPEINDSAFVGEKLGAFEATVDALFIPGACGPFIGFVLPFSLVGGDDGAMNAVVWVEAGDNFGGYADPMPTRGHLTLDIRTPPPAPVDGAVAYFTRLQSPRVHRFVPRRISLP